MKAAFMKSRQDTIKKHDFERSTKMNLIQEDLARAHVRARLEQARERRRGHQLAMARRLSRKAERAAAEARLALSRAS